jgi:two-component sensor histidine kinase
VKEEKLPVESLWSRRSGLFSLLVAVIVSLIGVVLDRLLLKEGFPRLDMLIFSNGVTGLFAGGLFWQMAREAKAGRALVEERMKTIAELNHHIRNALQVIKFLGGQKRTGLDAVQLQLINDSADRIEWALRELLPRYPMGQMSTPVSDEKVDAIRPFS